MPVVTAAIRSEGRTIDPAYIIAALDVVHEVNRIPYAQIRLYDGDPAGREFPISDSTEFEPGKHVEIDLRYEGGDTFTVFSGVVVGHSIEASVEASMLIIDLKARALRMTMGRRSAIYEKKTDDKIITALLDRNLLSGEVPSTQTEHLSLVQVNCTDWDFMMARAEANGLLVSVEDDQITLVEIEFGGNARHSFDYGIDLIYEIEMSADAQHQYEGVESVGWDAGQHKPTAPAKAKERDLKQGNLNGRTLARTLGGEALTLRTALPLPKAELQAWSDATLARSRLSLLRGRVSVPGDGHIRVLDSMSIQGVSKRFTGTALVTGVRHQVDVQGWRTDVQFGLSPRRFSQQPDVSDAPAAGLLPAVHGLHIGLVTTFDEDPDKAYRVKVVLPGVDPEKGVVWARLAMPDAGKDRGSFFWPEPGDEVVIGFFNDDPRQPVILGSLYSSKNTLPKGVPAPNKDNHIKWMVTRSGTTIRFDDENAAIHIETPNKNLVVLDDKAEQIEIKDQHGSAIMLNKDGITLKSAKDFTIDAASGSVTIKGSKVDVQ